MLDAKGTGALTAGERTLLQAMRYWRHGGAAALAATRRALADGGVPTEALIPMATLFGALHTDAARPMAVRAPGSPACGADEGVFLDAMAAAQRGEEHLAMELFDRWLPIVALCLAVQAAGEVGAILRRIGHTLPGGHVHMDRIAQTEIPALAAE